MLYKFLNLGRWNYHILQSTYGWLSLFSNHIIQGKTKILKVYSDIILSLYSNLQGAQKNI